MTLPPTPSVDAQLGLYALPGVPEVQPGADVAQLLTAATAAAGLSLQDGDVLCVASKLLSRAQGRFVLLGQVKPSERARRLSRITTKDPRLVELVLRESSYVSRAAPGILIVRHRLGFVCANAGIDESNARPDGLTDLSQGPTVLLLPEDPDGAATALRRRLTTETGRQISIIITDSHSRAFRLGTVGVAIGCAGLPPLYDHRGRVDRHGRPLQHTVTATADQVAAAADLVAGQADEGRPAILIRGLRFPPSDRGAQALYRHKDQDLFV